jgi:cell division protein FtsN
MGYRGRRGKDIEPVSGRKIIIVIVVVTSALSFTLGYFVGKAGLKEKQQYAGDVAPKTEVLPHPPQAEEHPPKVEQSNEEVTSIPQEKEEKTSQSDTASVKTPLVEKEANRPVTIKEEMPVQDVIKYTIQAGAFKSLKEAEVSKLRLENKGYKAYVKKSVSAKSERLFKVRIGDFVNKEEAETIALKLRKDGVNAFVTPKDEPKDKVQRENKNLSSDKKKEKPR